MRTTWGVVKISGSLFPSLRKLHEVTMCQGLVSLVALYLFLRIQMYDAAKEFIILPLLDPIVIPLDIDRTVVIIQFEDSPP